MKQLLPYIFFRVALLPVELPLVSEVGSYQKDLDRLKGQWLVTSLRWQKLNLLLVERKWVFEGAKLTIIDSDNIQEKWEIAIQPDKTPKHIDLKLMDQKGATSHKGIYNVEGNELKIAFTVIVPDIPGADAASYGEKSKAMRPKDFGSDSSQLVITLQRDPPKKE